MSKVISVINWKGGVGKTTLTYHIGIKIHGLMNDVAKFPKTDGFPRTLLIDLDPQCNLSIACMSEETFERRVYRDKSKIKTVKDFFDAYLDNNLSGIDPMTFVQTDSVWARKGRIFRFVDLLPSHPDLIYTDMEIANFSKRNYRKTLMASEIYKFQIVNSLIRTLRDQYEYILIDCPPNLNYITQNALYESDFYFIPTILDRLSSYGIVSIKNKVDELNKVFATSAGTSYRPTRLAGIVANNVREYGGQPKQTQYNVLSSLKKTFGKKVFDNYLTNGDGIARALEQGVPVFALEGAGHNALKQSEALTSITRELLERVK
jgi:chromosome partitioning protein